MSPTNTPHFYRKGIEIVPGFLSGAECETLLSAIREYRLTHELPVIYRQVRERSLHYVVMEGSRFHEALPDSQVIVDRIRHQLESICGESLALIGDARAACNINITPPGGQYRWHYDRNLVTALVYLNVVEGGETDLYPNYRIRLSAGRPHVLQSLLDRMLLSKVLRAVAGKPTSITPSEGTLVGRNGRRVRFHHPRRG